MIEAYPLAWPVGWPRTPEAERARARFNRKEYETHRYTDGSTSTWTRNKQVTVAEGIRRVLSELAKMDVSRDGIVISTNVRTRNDGLPYSSAREPDDIGAAAYWHSVDGPQCMAIDIYDRLADNLAAIAASIAALRAIERHGGAQILRRAFQGFKALPAQVAPTLSARDAAAEIAAMGNVADSSDDVLSSREDARRAIRSARFCAHPDRRNGEHDWWGRVEAAREVLERHFGERLV